MAVYMNKEINKKQFDNICNWIKDDITVYKKDELSEFLSETGYTLEEFNEGRKKGYMKDATTIDDCTYLNQTKQPITNITQIADLILENMEDSNFLDVIDMINEDARDDPRQQVDKNNILDVVKTYFDYCWAGFGDIALIKNKGYKNGDILVIMED